MNRENVSMAVGFVLLALGIVILLYTFMQAYALVNNVGDYFREQFPEDEEDENFDPPRAGWSWSSSDLTVDFSDETEEGDGAITKWSWEFDDGGASSQQNPQYTYSEQGTYRVRLEVEDENGETNTAYGDVYVENGNSMGGSSEENFGDIGVDFNVGNIFGPFAAAILVGILYIVMFLVGGSLVKAGWNLVKPGPSTVKLKIRPKRVDTEFEGQPYPGAAPYYPPQDVGIKQMPAGTAQRGEYPPDEEVIKKGT